MIRVVLADDQDLIRLGLRVLLDNEDDLTVVGDAADGLRAVALARELRPDVVLMDVRMPGIDGIEATRRIVAAPDLGATRIIVLTELLRAVRLVAAGDALLSPSVTRRVVREFAGRATRTVRPHPQLPALTDRERETVVLVAEGLSNEELAERMLISPATARTHVSRAITKLGARDRAQLVVFAYQSGLVD
jgi:DNA-binding NarL/FixJ family response regulator